MVIFYSISQNDFKMVVIYHFGSKQGSCDTKVSDTRVGTIIKLFGFYLYGFYLLNLDFNFIYHKLLVECKIVKELLIDL